MIVVKKIFNKCIAIGQTSIGSFLDKGEYVQHHAFSQTINFLY